MGPGNHSITIETILASEINGMGALRVDTTTAPVGPVPGPGAPVPVPGALLLGMIGLSTVGWLGRRRML